MIATLLIIGSLFRALLFIAYAIVLVLALLDLFKRSMPQNTKLLWLIIILVAPFIGSLIYLFWGRHQNINLN